MVLCLTLDPIRAPHSWKHPPAESSEEEEEEEE